MQKNTAPAPSFLEHFIQIRIQIWTRRRRIQNGNLQLLIGSSISESFNQLWISQIINWISDFSDWIIQWFSESLSLWVIIVYGYISIVYGLISPFHHKQWIRGSSGLPPPLRGLKFGVHGEEMGCFFVEVTVMATTTIVMVPSGKRLHNYGKLNHHFQWVNPRTKWPFSIAVLNYQRVTTTIVI